jgi:hypothetical protein
MAVLLSWRTVTTLYVTEISPAIGVSAYPDALNSAVDMGHTTETKPSGRSISTECSSEEVRGLL